MTPICADDEEPYGALEVAGAKVLPASGEPAGKGRAEGGLENADCPAAAAVVSGDWPMLPKGSLLLDA